MGPVGEKGDKGWTGFPGDPGPQGDRVNNPFFFLFCFQSGFQMTVEKTSTKVITPTNHNRSKQRDEPIRILSKRPFAATRLSSNVLQSISQAESSDLLPFPLIIFGEDEDDKSLKSSVKAIKSSLINQ